METKLLAIYLNDHLAGSVAGVELARRARDSNAGSELGEFLEELAREIDADREALLAIMAKLEIRADPLKRTVAWAAEKIARAKPNGQLTGYSPLSRVIELEGLTLGVTGKLALWRSLAATRADLTEFRLEDLIARAEHQRDGIERHRIDAARRAFGSTATADVA